MRFVNLLVVCLTLFLLFPMGCEEQADADTDVDVDADVDADTDVNTDVIDQGPADWIFVPDCFVFCHNEDYELISCLEKCIEIDWTHPIIVPDCETECGNLAGNVIEENPNLDIDLSVVFDQCLDQCVELDQLILTCSYLDYFLDECYPTCVNWNCQYEYEILDYDTRDLLNQCSYCLFTAAFESGCYNCVIDGNSCKESITDHLGVNCMW